MLLSMTNVFSSQNSSFPTMVPHKLDWTSKTKPNSSPLSSNLFSAWGCTNVSISWKCCEGEKEAEHLKTLELLSKNKLILCQTNTDMMLCPPRALTGEHHVAREGSRRRPAVQGTSSPCLSCSQLPPLVWQPGWLLPPDSLGLQVWFC